ncbi:hypothetical protein [uncultured Clostridium sp.]|uniref:hypothetical protein n=1 Tax=uncultured Clostridium sp. TaxID=59620 RepID=UPI0025DF900B|nr:hypothetical protein [uncultured Clostridium sp.]
MSLDIKGINNLIKKLDNLSNIDTKSVVHRVAEDMTLSIQDEVKKFSDKYEYVGQCHVRCYRKGIYIDVGLSNDLDPWDDWKELWYHQWGYRDYGLNFSGSPFIDVHKMWFDIAVKNAETEVKKELKEKLKEEIDKNIKKG